MLLLSKLVLFGVRSAAKAAAKACRPAGRRSLSCAGAYLVLPIRLNVCNGCNAMRRHGGGGKTSQLLECLTSLICGFWLLSASLCAQAQQTTFLHAAISSDQADIGSACTIIKAQAWIHHQSQ